MSFFRRGRFLFWLTRELINKYKRALIVGIAVGIGLMILFWKYAPVMVTLWFSPVERIGIIGEYTPTTLPLFIQNEISMGLTDIGGDGNAVPALALHWEATDSGKIYTFTLRSDLIWHSGERVKPEDVNYNIRDVTFEPIDSKTLKATLKNPYSPFPTLVAKPIMQRGLNGFGPYKVAGLQLKGDTVSYLRLIPVNGVRNPVKEYRFFRTEAQAFAAFKLGDIDILKDIGTKPSESAWGKSQIQESIRYDRVVALFFNTKTPFLSERNMRQALAYALPTLEGDQAYSPLAKYSWAYSDKVRQYKPNIEQSKKLLNGATSSSELTITTFSPYVDLAQSIANRWNDLGIVTKVKVENAITNSYQILLTTQYIPPDPDQYPLWHSTQLSTNITSYVNVKVDKLLEDARRESDQTVRKKLYADFQRYLVEDAPAVFLYYPKSYTIARIH